MTLREIIRWISSHAITNPRLRMDGTYLRNQKLNSIKIPVVRDIKKIWKNHPYLRYQENLYWIIIMPKNYQQINKKNEMKRNFFFHSIWSYRFFRIHMNFFQFFFAYENTVFEQNWSYDRATFSSIARKSFVCNMKACDKNISGIRT